MFDQTKVAKKYLKPGAKILDLGAGDFSDIKELEKFGYVCEGVDLKTGTDLNKLYVSNQAPFDMVMSNFVLHFLENQEQLIETAFKNLSNKGIFYFQDLEFQAITGKKYLTKKQSEDLIVKKGFKIISSESSKYFDDKEGHKHWHVILEVVATKLI